MKWFLWLPWVHTSLLYGSNHKFGLVKFGTFKFGE